VTAGPPVCFAEEAVNEVKRQAMSELQKAVSDAERKAHELITTERAKMERALAEAKRQASEDALTVINQQEDSSEVGLLATPTLCSLSPGPLWSDPGLITPELEPSSYATSELYELSPLGAHHGCHRWHAAGTLSAQTWPGDIMWASPSHRCRN
jgi:hypothetical protein